MCKRFLWFMLSLGVTLTANAADFDFSAYKRTTIAGFLEKHKTTECRKLSEPTTVISAVPHKYSIVTNFSRDLRPLTQENKEFLKKYGKAIRSNQQIVEMYKNEVLVQENGVDYWVPVQEQLIPALGEELKQGQRFVLYVVLIGAVNNRCVFIATEFNASPKDA